MLHNSQAKPRGELGSCPQPTCTQPAGNEDSIWCSENGEKHRMHTHYIQIRIDNTERAVQGRCVVARHGTEHGPWVVCPRRKASRTRARGDPGLRVESCYPRRPSRDRYVEVAWNSRVPTLDNVEWADGRRSPPRLRHGRLVNELANAEITERALQPEGETREREQAHC